MSAEFRPEYWLEDWEGLKHGVLAKPASLQLQCLLFIIGNLYQIPSVELLPLSIRRRLLLLLPAIDVCKLEGTLLTADISMDDEIWRELYNKRMPLRTLEEWKNDSEVAHYLELYSPCEMRKAKGIDCTWKQSYFEAVFSLNAYDMTSFEEHVSCDCDPTFYHFIYDMLYGIYSCYGTNDVSLLFDNAAYCIHDVYRSAQKCLHLTPKRYCGIYRDKIQRENKCYWSVPVSDLMQILTGICHVGFKHFKLFSLDLEEQSNAMDDVSVREGFGKLLSTVESIAVHPCHYLKPNAMKQILDAVFLEKKTVTKVVSIDDYFQALPYLTSSPSCDLKQLELKFEISNQVNIDLLPKVIQRHQSLERFIIAADDYSTDSIDDVLSKDFISQALTDLLYRPTFKEVFFKGEMSPEAIQVVLCQFLLSPYSVTLSLNIYCSEFDALTESLPFNSEQSEKSLVLNECTLSANLVSLLPPSLVLKSLNFIHNDYRTIQGFANLQSIKVDSFTLASGVSQIVVSDVCSIFRIVTAQEWNIDVAFSDFNDGTIETFTSALSAVADRVQRFVLQTVYNTNFTSGIESLLETIFLSLSSSKRSPYLVLGFSWIDDKFAESVRAVWERCGAVKLKGIEVTVSDFNVSASSLSDMIAV